MTINYCLPPAPPQPKGARLLVPVRLDLDRRTAVAEVPSLMALLGFEAEGTDFEGDFIARLEIQRRPIRRVDGGGQQRGMLTVEHLHDGEVVTAPPSAPPITDGCAKAKLSGRMLYIIGLEAVAVEP
jgi:hypothetical protein